MCYSLTDFLNLKLLIIYVSTYLRDMLLQNIQKILFRRNIVFFLFPTRQLAQRSIRNNRADTGFILRRMLKRQCISYKTFNTLTATDADTVTFLSDISITESVHNSQ